MSHRLTKEELDEQFELFLKESVSDDSVDLGGAAKPPSILDSLGKASRKAAQKAAVSGVPQWQDDDDSDGVPGRGLLGSRKAFRKSLRNSQPIREEDEEVPGDEGLREEEGMKAAILGKDSTEPEDSMVASGLVVNMACLGLDTLEEEEEKTRFFAQLEAGACSTIDYSKLNRELDSTISTVGTTLSKTVEQSKDDQREGGVIEPNRHSPGSPHYSEDFEDEGSGEEPPEEKPERTLMLAKVSLHDSLDSTGGEDRKRDPAGSLTKGQSYAQSGGSEMEALHEAYREISHAVDGSDDHHYSFIERRGRSSGPVSPSSPPQHSRQTLQPASTTESDLPTAEELMRPIRPERAHVRGFSLQPFSGVELDPDKTAGPLERSSPVSIPRQPGKLDPAVGMGAFSRSTTPPLPSLDPPRQDPTWSIREEVERLMQDQDKPFLGPSTQAGKAKKQVAPRGSNSAVNGPSNSLVKKPAVAPVRGRRMAGRSAAASRWSKPNIPAATAAKPPSAHPQALQHTPTPTESQEKNYYTHTEPGLKVSSELMASVQSFTAFLQHQIDASNRQDDTVAQEVKGHQETQQLTEENREEESSLVDGLRVQLAQKERELQLMQQHKEELNSLRQHNYVLQSKLRSAEEASQESRWGEATDPATEEKLKLIEKEMLEQETLINGYHQENERLYLQMKAQQSKSKANEEAMFAENQRLLNELASANREQFNKTPRPVGHVCLMDHTQRITELLAQMNAVQRNEAKLLEETQRLKQEKQVLEVDLQLIKKERDLARAQVASASGGQSFEMRVQEDSHREEVAALKKKLQWFAENQELLDRDAARLKAATTETLQLKEQVEKLKMDVRKSVGQQNKNKAKERAGDAKRIQDLERQVKELEQILRRRNPNSLPALIYAAASAGGPEDLDTTTDMSPPSRVSALLERRIQRLEAELESHDEEAKRSLRAMEQQFQRIKLRYEQQISELEQQLAQKQHLEAARSTSRSEMWESQARTLEEELQQVKDTHQDREKSLQGKIQSLQQQLNHKQAQPSPSRQQCQANAAFGVRIDRLNQELAAKTRTIQELNRTVERLQKERKNMLSVPSPRKEAHCSGDAKRQPASSKMPFSANPGEGHGGEETFPATQYEKAYQPTTFTGSHITEVLQDNEALREHVELLELQKEQEKEALKAAATQAQDELCRLKECSAEQLSSMKAEHLRVLDRLRATHALEHSSSKVAELTNKVNTQEIMLRRLRDEVKELQRAKEALVVSKIREDTLQNQLTRLLEELKQAKEAHSPELKHFCSLERKILNMELRHQQREKELQKVIGGSWQGVEADQQSEVERWRHLAQEKSRELGAFHLELDSILDILRQLHRQGVVLPCPAPHKH